MCVTNLFPFLRNEYMTVLLSYGHFPFSIFLPDSHFTESQDAFVLFNFNYQRDIGFDHIHCDLEVIGVRKSYSDFQHAKTGSLTVAESEYRSILVSILLSSCIP